LLADEQAVKQGSAGAKFPSAAAQKAPLLVTPSASATKPRKTRVVLITDPDSDRSTSELERLSRPGGDFEQLRGRGWKIGPGPENHLQIIDRQQAAALVTKLAPREFPAVACIEGEEIVRSFRAGCTTPLDMWTFGWLHKGIDERPPGVVPEAARVETTGHFPLRGNHWTIDGDANPPRAIVISHLHGGFHGGQLSSTWEIEKWSYEELRSVHDYLHERYGGGVSHASSSRSRSSNRSTSQFSAGRKTLGH
jgi:hypothetical protein